MQSLRDISKIELKLTIGETLKPKIEMSVHELNLQDVGRNIKIGFFRKENRNTMYGIEIVLQRSLKVQFLVLEYSWNLQTKSSTNPVIKSLR